MKAGTSTHEVGESTGAGITEDQSLPPARRATGIAGALRARRAAVLILIAATGAGCAANNYDFDALSEVSGYSRVERLTEDLVQEQEGGKDQELYDMEMIPLLHTHVNVFSEADEEGIPGGFVEADIDAYLPLFAFVDGTVDRYDSDRNLYEHHTFNSYLWGLFQTHREQLDTKAGLRVKKTRRFLWIFGWSPSPEYVDSASEVPSQ